MLYSLTIRGVKGSIHENVILIDKCEYGLVEQNPQLKKGFSMGLLQWWNSSKSFRSPFNLGPQGITSLATSLTPTDMTLKWSSTQNNFTTQYPISYYYIDAYKAST